MKLLFDKNDSIYKIIQTIKKIPNYKKPTIDIHKDHRIFQHQRWGSYLKVIIEEHHLDVTFIAHTKLHTQYREKAELPYKFSGKRHPIITAITNPKSVRSKIKSFHTTMLIEKNYISFFVLLTELAVLLSLLYVFWNLISPNATIYITPAHNIEHVVYNFRYYPREDRQVHEFQPYLSIPYSTGSLPYSYAASLNVQNVSYDQKEANGIVELYNTFSYTYSLKNNTTVITDDGELFTFDSRVDVPGGSAEKPGIRRVRVTAKDRYDSGELIGASGNIPKGKILYIKNLEESVKDQMIYGVAYAKFDGGEDIETGTVIEEDIKRIEKTILDDMDEQKTQHITENYKDGNHLVLPYSDLYTFDIQEFVTTSEVGEETSFVEGKVETELHFPIVSRDHIVKSVEEYIIQRANNETYATDIDRNGITMYTLIEKGGDDDIPAHFIIPTRVPLIKTYNIQKDQLGIIEEIKDRILGLDKDAAAAIINSYEGIDGAKVAITPRWFNLIPTVKARISFEFDN